MAFIIRHSLLGMFLAAIAGFLLPAASAAAFPFLPYVLFFLMLLTLLGMPIDALLQRVRSAAVWRYTLMHSAGMMALLFTLGTLLSVSKGLMLALLAVGATGSLFATPAIVRALGLDSLQAMAMTIASTLSLPLVILIPITFFSAGDESLNWSGYFMRLFIFIAGPLLISYCLRRFAPKEAVDRLLLRISPYTILLVFAFPFGLIGDFRYLFDREPMTAVLYLGLAVTVVSVFFGVVFWLYRQYGWDMALMAAITSGNRNVLLTYTIAGGLLGSAFLPLAGAMQVPTYFLPVFTRWLAKRAPNRTPDHS